MREKRWQRKHSLQTIPPELQLTIIEYLDAQGRASLIESDLLPPSLLVCGNELDEFDERGHTLLHASAQQNYLKTARLLLAAGASTSLKSEVTTDHSATPLVLASKNGNLSILHLLIDHGAKADEWSYSGITCLHHACENGHIRIVEALIEHGADVNSRVYDVGTPLIVAATAGHAEIVGMLIASGAKLNSMRRHMSGMTALHYAALNGHIECVRNLLKAGAIATYDPAPENPGWFVRPPNLHEIAAGPHYVAAERWADEHGSRSSRSSLVLDWKEGEKEAYAEILRLLSEAGGDVSAETPAEQGVTALHYAVIVGNCAAVKVLLSEGANVSARINNGHSAIAFARVLGYEDVIAVLERAMEARPEKRRMPIVGPKPQGSLREEAKEGDDVPS
ncbi:ankyrin repeat-containing domain protein [Aspergillus pseudoustus]|uniref:Ankyrin repeat-containing domain protein n=1 Tax=Aspergillus pseudoustus TaxID=1810923 RepID=A0ABR4KY82_9EURO